MKNTHAPAPRAPRPPSRKKSRALLARLARVESPDVTYLGERFPIVMERGRGLTVTDVDGNRYLDFTACFGVLALGHRPAAVTTALRAQGARLVHGMGDVHPTAVKIRLLEHLAALTPFSHANTVLSLSGGEAVESALKTALLATGRTRFLSFRGGYHGLHMGPLGLNDNKTFTRGFEPWLGDRNLRLPFPYEADAALDERTLAPALDPQFLRDTHDLHAPQEVLTQLEDALRTRTFAAIVLEPIQGRGGERAWPAGFLKAACALAQSYGTLVIFDEIYTGFGRTGPLFALEDLDLVPDLLCLGKALGGGLPLSACVGERDLFSVWGKSAGEARHTSTFLGHPLACAAGHAALKEIVRRLPEFRTSQRAVLTHLEAFVRRWNSTAKHDAQRIVLRGRGAMLGLWFPFGAPGCAAALATDLLEDGFIVLPSGPRGDVLSFTPPLIASEAAYKKATAALFARLSQISH